MSAIAEFYASMQFRVDSSGLTAFRTEMELVKKEMALTLAIISKTATSLKGMLKSFESMQGKFDAKSMASWRKSIAAAARAYVKVMEASNGVLHQVAQEASKSQIKLSNFEKRLNSNIVALNSYAQALMPVVLLLERLRGAAGSPLPRVGGGFRGGANGGSGAGGGAPHPPSGAGAGGMGGMLAGAGLMSFMRPMLPTGMGIGGLLGSGYAFREIVTAGRELQAMEFKLKAVSESAEVFNSNLKFVKETSQGLALNVTEFGASYASIFQSAKRFAGVEQIQEMSLGMNKYFRTLQMTPDQIKGSLRAVGQMLNKEQVMAEELKNQLGERAAGVMDIFAKAAGTDVKGLFKLMQDGKVGSDIVLKAGVLMGEWADKQGTLSQALELSAAKQEQFNNTLKEMSLLILKSGLDKLLSMIFTLGSEVVNGVTVGVKGLVNLFGKLNTFAKSSLDVIKEHPFISGGIAIFLGMALAINAMNKNMFGFLNKLADVLLAVKNLNAALLVSAARTAAMVAGLATVVYLFSELEGYFNGEENNVLMVWYHGVQLLISEFDLMFAKIKLGWAEVRNGINPFADYNAQGMDTGNRSVNIPLITPLIDSMIRNIITPTSDFIRSGVGLQPQSNDHWYSAPTGMNKPQSSIINNINIDISKAPINVQRAIENGDMAAMGNYLAQEIQSSYGGVGSYAS